MWLLLLVPHFLPAPSASVSVFPTCVCVGACMFVFVSASLPNYIPEIKRWLIVPINENNDAPLTANWSRQTGKLPAEFSKRSGLYQTKKHTRRPTSCPSGLLPLPPFFRLSLSPLFFARPDEFICSSSVNWLSVIFLFLDNESCSNLRLRVHKMK